MWILIPAKSATRAKSRLSPVLDNKERAALARLLLARLLMIISALDEVTGVVVVSADAELRAMAHLFGYHSLPDPEPDLNASLEAGRQYALAQGAEALLVLPTDLPRLSPETLTRLLAHTNSEGACIVIAHDKDRTGTNALFQRPANAIPFHFGINSGPKHRALAAQAGIPLVEFRDPALTFDLDWPQDWKELLAPYGHYNSRGFSPF
ncbi:MAG: 2-phospho-L-lactate guanylyltransferase [Ardenticatenaceae bacterium]